MCYGVVGLLECVENEIKFVCWNIYFCIGYDEFNGVFVGCILDVRCFLNG